MAKLIKKKFLDLLNRRMDSYSRRASDLGMTYFRYDVNRNELGFDPDNDALQVRGKSLPVQGLYGRYATAKLLKSSTAAYGKFTKPEVLTHLRDRRDNTSQQPVTNDNRGHLHGCIQELDDLIRLVGEL